MACLKGLDLLSSTRFNSSRAGRRVARIRAFKYRDISAVVVLSLTSTSSSRRAATKSTAKALSLCGARCRGVWRSCASELALRCAAWFSLWGGIRAFLFLCWRVSRATTGVSGMHGHARAREIETSRAPPQVLAHGHTCSRRSRAASSLGQHAPNVRTMSRGLRNAACY